MSALPARRGAPHPPARPPRIDLVTPWPDPRKPGAPPLSHLQWAEGVARAVAAAAPFRFGRRSQEADDLVSVAHVVLVELAKRFEAGRVGAGSCPDQLFRGWAHIYLPGECRREAERLRNAGLYRTTSKREVRNAACAARGLCREEDCPNCSDRFIQRFAEKRPAARLARCPNCAEVMAAREFEDGEDVNAWLRAHGYG